MNIKFHKQQLEHISNNVRIISKIITLKRCSSLRLLDLDISIDLRDWLFYYLAILKAQLRHKVLDVVKSIDLIEYHQNLLRYQPLFRRLGVHGYLQQDEKLKRREWVFGDPASWFVFGKLFKELQDNLHSWDKVLVGALRLFVDKRIWFH